jgi:hypothetical protein
MPIIRLRRAPELGPGDSGTFGEMISDASLKEDWVMAAMRTLNRVRL